MIETVAVVGVVLMLVLVAALGGFASVDLLLGAGVGVLALGLIAGVAAGVVYHVALFRALSPLGILRPGWWWRPTSLHAHLTPSQWRRVRPWFHAGAAGFFVVLAGCALIFIALLTL